MAVDSDVTAYLLVAALGALFVYGIVTKFTKDRKFKQSLKKGLDIRTASRVTVQSHGEEVLANFFHGKKIRFVYDKPTRFSFFQGSAIRPDFYLPDFDVYVEYWGMKGNAEYDRKTRWKKGVYRKYNKRLIDIYVSDIKSERYLKKFQEFGIT